MASENVFRDFVIAVIAICLPLAGCAEFVRPVQPGTTINQRPGVGLAFGRIAMIREGEDRMTSLPSFPRSFGWELVQAESGKSYIMDPLTEDGKFAALLPAGLYHITKLRYEDRSGLWEGRLSGSFVVKSAGSTYLGTWEISFAGLGSGVPLIARTVNDLNEERDAFQDSYKINARPLSVALLESAKEGYLSLVRPRSEQ